MKDYKHAEMILQYFNTWKKLVPNICLEMEAPYNYYGERGIVDLASLSHRCFKPCFSKGEIACPEFPHIDLVEFKTKLVDLGETIRQVKKAQKYFVKSNDVIGGTLIKNKKEAWIWSYLIFADTVDNINILIKYRDAFSNIDNCSVGLLIHPSRSQFFYNQVLPFFSLCKTKADRELDYVEEKAFFNKIEFLNEHPIVEDQLEDFDE